MIFVGAASSPPTFRAQCARWLLPLAFFITAAFLDSAVYASEAQDLLDRVSAQQQQLQDLRSHFRIRTTIQGVPEINSEGELFFLRPDRCRFRFTRPTGMDMAVGVGRFRMRLPSLGRIIEQDIGAALKRGTLPTPMGMDWAALSRLYGRRLIVVSGMVPGRRTVTVDLDTATGFSRVELDIEEATYNIRASILELSDGRTRVVTAYDKFLESTPGVATEVRCQVLTKDPPIVTVMTLSEVVVNGGVTEQMLVIE